MENDNKIINENNLITLKEASKISGYSPDYIGQLIRSGKIPGKQIYYNIAWMTTAEDVLNYKKNGESNKKLGIKDILSLKSRKFILEINVLKLFLKNFKSSLPVLIVLLISFLFLNIYIFYYFTNNVNNNKFLNSKKDNTQENLSF